MNPSPTLPNPSPRQHPTRLRSGPGRPPVVLGMAALLAAALATPVGAAVHLQPSEGARLDFPSADGPIRAMIVTNGIAFLAGSFTQMGANSGGGVVLEIPSGVVDFTQARANGAIETVVSDSNGGWYLGGSFTTVGGLTRIGLAHLRADGTVNPTWVANLNVGSTVHAIAVAGGSIYLGGTFTLVAGQARSRIASISTANAQIQPWNPGVGGSAVRAIAVAGTRILVGGSFTNAGNQARANLASLDASSGAATGWNPSPDGPINALALSGLTLYCGGEFTTIAGESRTNFAVLNSFTGSLEPVRPAPDGPVAAALLHQNRLYLAGLFNQVGGVARTNIAAVDPNTGDVLPWTANVPGVVYSIAAVGDTLAAGGEFERENGGRNFDLISLTTGSSLLGESLNPAGQVRAVALSDDGTTGFVGGLFSVIDPVLRSGLAAVRVEDSAILPFDAQLQTSRTDSRPFVNSIALHDGVLYAGGSFEAAGSSPRTNLVALAPDTGAALDWTSGANGDVESVFAHDTRLFASGRFSSLGGAARTNAGAVLLTTGEATDWAPGPNATINAFDVGTNGVLYVGGGFTSIAGETRGRLAAFNLADGTLLPWDPFANGIVDAIAVHGDMIFAGGTFLSVGGAFRTNLAALNGEIGNALDWTANTVGRVRYVRPVGDQLLIGGDFLRVNDVARSRAALLTLTNGAVESWSPGFGATVSTLGWTDDQVIAGGEFTSVSGPVHLGMAAFRAEGFAVLSAAAATNRTVNVEVVANNGEAIALQASTNLLDWVTLQSNRVVNGVIRYNDPAAAAGGARRFYRTLR
ncbi:MAG: hypothetical protein AB7O66_00365 [Limisphaerales bacterium]